jgi:hypothetical protein
MEDLEWWSDATTTRGDDLRDGDDNTEVRHPGSDCGGEGKMARQRPEEKGRKRGGRRRGSQASRCALRGRW